MKKLSIAFVTAGLLLAGCDCPDCPPEKQCPECPEVAAPRENGTTPNPNLVDGKDTTTYITSSQLGRISVERTFNCQSLNKYYKNTTDGLITISIKASPCADGMMQIFVFNKDGDEVSTTNIANPTDSMDIEVPAGAKVNVFCAGTDGNCKIRIVGHPV